MSRKTVNRMDGISSYGRELSPEEIAAKNHREVVGGLWDEIGKLQFDFLVAQGLKPSHKLLDIGCGCLRGGLHFIGYLEAGNYCGLDVNTSLVEAGLQEITEAGLENKQPRLLVDDQFQISRFERRFDFMLSISLFTHLPINIIVRCLSNARQHLTDAGIYYSTFFEAPHPAYLEPLPHQPGGAITYYDQDLFHYSFEEIQWMAKLAGLAVRKASGWSHPRDQQMCAFYKPAADEK